MNFKSMHTLKSGLVVMIAMVTFESLAAGASDSVASAAQVVSGKITEWQVPVPKYPRDPAIGPDGNVYFAVRSGDKIARFDPKSKRFQDWDVPVGTQPLGLVVTRDNQVLFGGYGNGTIGELSPSSGRIKSLLIPSIDSNPYTLVLDADDNIWFTLRKAGKVAKLDRASGKITEYPIGDKPYSVALDHSGHVWVTRMSADRIVRLDPNTGKFTELLLSLGSQPRRTAVAPDGMLWVSLYGTGRLAKIDPTTSQVVRQYELPGGPNAGPYAVNADSRGRIWVSEIQTDSVVMLDPRSEEFRVFKLPTKDAGIRNAAIDAEGHYWYVSSQAGKLGVIE